LTQTAKTAPVTFRLDTETIKAWQALYLFSMHPEPKVNKVGFNHNRLSTKITTQE
jgi:hypothetical protein